MKIKFLGAARTVTGSCFLVDNGNKKFLVDCGAFQGPNNVEDLNREAFLFNPAELDYVFLTHAHYDHCGRLPILVKQGFRGKIFSTQPTRDLARVVLIDSAKLQLEDFERWEARSKNETYSDASEQGAAYFEKKPLFSEQDVEETMNMFEVYPYGNSVKLSDDLEFRMRDAGHILGSSMFEIWTKTEAGRERKLVFSGDLGQPGARIVRDPDMIREADYVVCESTYGNRLHKNRDETILEFLNILKEAQQSGGNILIPSFALERTQEILYELNHFVENKLLDGLTVYLDSPMASKATNIFKMYPNFYDEDTRRLLEKGDDPFDFPGYNVTESADDSKRLIDRKGIVIIAGSGMCTGGRIIHHLKNNLANPKTHVVIVGYQVNGTLGRRLVDKQSPVRIFGEDIEVNAKIHTLGGFSAHADQRDLRYWLRSFGKTPKKVFMVHGDEEITIGFASNLKSELDLDIEVPKLNEEFELK